MCIRDRVRSEDAALEQEFVIGFERIQHFDEAGRNLLDEFLLFRRKFIKVAVLSLSLIHISEPTRPY
mgnify:CR=1 FL=1